MTDERSQLLELVQAYKRGSARWDAVRDAVERLAARAAPAQDVTATEWNEMRDAMENCRLYAARHRKEEWARTILDFCKEAGVTGSPLRAAPAQPKLGDDLLSPMELEARKRDRAECAARAAPAQPAGERVLLYRDKLSMYPSWHVVPTGLRLTQDPHCEYAWATIEPIPSAPLPPT
jgi:hypothetical protein